MDKVFIKELCIETVIGVYDWERKIKQAVCIDLELGTQISAASDSDNIEDAIDYKEVAKTVSSAQTTQTSFSRRCVGRPQALLATRSASRRSPSESLRKCSAMRHQSADLLCHP